MKKKKLTLATIQEAIKVLEQDQDPNVYTLVMSREAYLLNLISWAWSIIANADFDKQSKDWKKAAHKWRKKAAKYHTF